MITELLVATDPRVNPAAALFGRAASDLGRSLGALCAGIFSIFETQQTSAPQRYSPPSTPRAHKDVALNYKKLPHRRIPDGLVNVSVADVTQRLNSQIDKWNMLSWYEARLNAAADAYGRWLVHRECEARFGDGSVGRLRSRVLSRIKALNHQCDELIRKSVVQSRAIDFARDAVPLFAKGGFDKTRAEKDSGIQ